MWPAAGLGTVEELRCCEIQGFWKVRAFRWVFPNVLPNAAVNGGSLSLSHGSGLASEGTALSGRVAAGCQWRGRARPLAPLAASSSPEQVAGASRTARTAWPSTPAAASWHPAVLLAAMGTPRPSSSFPHPSKYCHLPGFPATQHI